MPRFATPKKTRTTVLGRSPTRAVVGEPGHRYGKGSPVKGPSMKGRHYIDIRVDGQNRRSPTSPRSVSPASRHSRDDITIESSVPPSTLRPFQKPRRSERAPRKDPIPVASSRGSRPGSPTRVHSRDGFSVNAEVISVGSESISRRRSGSSVNSRLNRDPFGSSDNQSVSGNTVASTASVRSTSSRFSQSGTISAVSTSSLFQPLAQSSPPAHGIHNIQLSHQAFRSVRKACVRDAISQFLENEDEYQQQTQKQQYFKTISRTNSLEDNELLQIGGESNPSDDPDFYHKKKHQRIMQMTEVLRDSIRNEIQSYPPKPSQQFSEIFFPSENTYDNRINEIRQEIGNILTDWKRQYMKEAIQTLDQHYGKWENIRNDVISRKKEYYHDKMLYFQDLTQQKQEKQKELIQLKRRAEELGLNLSYLLGKFPKYWFNENSLRDDTDEDERLDPTFDLKELQSSLNRSAASNRTSSRKNHKNRNSNGSNYEEDSGSGIDEDYLSKSVFLSPHLLQVAKQEKEMILGKDYQSATPLGTQQRNRNNSIDSVRFSDSSVFERQHQSQSPSRQNSSFFNNNNPNQLQQQRQAPPQADQSEWPSTILGHSSYVSFMPDPVQGERDASPSPPPPPPPPAATSTNPYQVSEYNQMLQVPSSPRQSEKKNKIDFSVIRLLAEQSPPPAAPAPQLTQEQQYHQSQYTPHQLQPPIPPFTPETNNTFTFSSTTVSSTLSPSPMPQVSPPPRMVSLASGGRPGGSGYPNQKQQPGFFSSPIAAPFTSFNQNNHNQSSGPILLTEEDLASQHAKSSVTETNDDSISLTVSQQSEEIEKEKQRSKMVKAKLLKKYQKK